MPPLIALASLPSAAVSPPPRLSHRAEPIKTILNAKDWEPFLQHLPAAGQIEIRTDLPGVSLEHHGHWRGVALGESFGLATGRRFRLWLLLDHWARFALLDAGNGDSAGLRRLGILNLQGTTLMELGVPQGGRDPALDALIRSHGAREAGDAPGRRQQCRSDTGRDPHHTCSEIGVARAFDDIAEATGRLHLHPARLRERGRATAVDAELIPCFLEALAEQALPVRLLTGTQGVAHSFDGAFFGHRRMGSWSRLQGDSAELRIDAARIDSAWVLKVPGEKAEQASLRLYDHQGRSITNIAAVPGFDHGENPIWRTLINALLD